MINEIWKVTKESHLYEVSNTGKIRHIFKNKEKKLQDNGNGYKIWGRTENGKLLQSYVHRTVYRAFVDEIPYGMTINHINFDRSCNELSNLELCSLKNNLNYSRKNGRYIQANKKQSERLKDNNPFKYLTKEQKLKSIISKKKNYKIENHGLYGKYGFDNPNFKYSKNDIELILNLFNKGKSMNSISKQLNIPYVQVYNFCKGKYKNILL